MSDRAVTFEEWVAAQWTPRARRLLLALLWTVAWMLLFHGLGSVLAAQSSAGPASCRSTFQLCVAMAPLDAP